MCVMMQISCSVLANMESYNAILIGQKAEISIERPQCFKFGNQAGGHISQYQSWQFQHFLVICRIEERKIKYIYTPRVSNNHGSSSLEIILSVYYAGRKFNFLCPKY